MNAECSFWCWPYCSWVSHLRWVGGWLKELEILQKRNGTLLAFHCFSEIFPILLPNYTAIIASLFLKFYPKILVILGWNSIILINTVMYYIMYIGNGQKKIGWSLNYCCKICVKVLKSYPTRDHYYVPHSLETIDHFTFALFASV